MLLLPVKPLDQLNVDDATLLAVGGLGQEIKPTVVVRGDTQALAVPPAAGTVKVVGVLLGGFLSPAFRLWTQLKFDFHAMLRE